MSELGKRIQRLRKDAKLTQGQLADKIRISLTQLVRYETKGVQPNADTLKNLSDIFDVSIDFLVNGTIDDKATNSINDQELLSQFKKVENLPADKKKLVIEFLDAFLFKTNVQQQLAS